MTFNEALPYVLVGLAILALLIALYYLTKRTTNVVAADRRDVLDEGAAPAERNQALIDAPDASVKAPVVEPAPAPVRTPAPTPAPAPAGKADDLTTIKGLGPKLAALLNEQGISSFAQIAEWDDAEIARIDELLGRFKGRIERDNWVEQAKLLAKGDGAGFAERFGQNG